MFDYCIYDRFEQCFGDCPNCPKSRYDSSRDDDFLYDDYDEMRDEEDAEL